MSKREDEPQNQQISPDNSNIRTYPYVKPREGEPDWKKMLLYGITGWMSSWYVEGGAEIAIAFGGYFKMDPEDSTLEGELIDIWGNAIIEGNLRLEKDQLYFIKTYRERYGSAARYPVEHLFRKRGDLWIGEFVFDHNDHFINKGGKAEAILTEFHNDAFGIVKGPLDWHKPLFPI